MIHCKHCIHWIDESLELVEADRSAHTHIFMGCRIFGNIQSIKLQSCDHYQSSADTFAICASCNLTVPKLCISLGECANCTDTDLFCVESCIGEEGRKYCTHFVRLHTEGAHLIDNDQVFDLFPAIGMPGRSKSDKNGASSRKDSEENFSGSLAPGKRN